MHPHPASASASASAAAPGASHSSCVTAASLEPALWGPTQACAPGRLPSTGIRGTSEPRADPVRGSGSRPTACTATLRWASRLRILLSLAMYDVDDPPSATPSVITMACPARRFPACHCELNSW